MCFSEDVTWLIADTGEVVQGPGSVRDYIVARHSTMDDAHTSKFVLARPASISRRTVRPRLRERASVPIYCIAHDMKDRPITAVRCYGLGAPSTV